MEKEYFLMILIYVYHTLQGVEEKNKFDLHVSWYLGGEEKEQHSRSALYSDFQPKLPILVVRMPSYCHLVLSKICRARNTLDLNHLQHQATPYIRYETHRRICSKQK